MTKRFDELYMSRHDHQKIVAFYKRVVVHLYGKLRETQRNAGDVADDGKRRQRLVNRQSDPQLKLLHGVRIRFGPRRSV